MDLVKDRGCANSLIVSKERKKEYIFRSSMLRLQKHLQKKTLASLKCVALRTRSNSWMEYAYTVCTTVLHYVKINMVCSYGKRVPTLCFCVESPSIAGKIVAYFELGVCVLGFGSCVWSNATYMLINLSFGVMTLMMLKGVLRRWWYKQRFSVPKSLKSPKISLKSHSADDHE